MRVHLQCNTQGDHQQIKRKRGRHTHARKYDAAVDLDNQNKTITKNTVPRTACPPPACLPASFQKKNLKTQKKDETPTRSLPRTLPSAPPVF